MNNLINSKNALSSASLLGCFVLLCFFFNAGYAQNIHVAENTPIANANLIHIAPVNQTQNTFSQYKSIIFVAENTLVSGWSHFELQILNNFTSQRTQLAIAKPKNHVVTKKATHPYLFSKTPLHNKNTFQTIESVATLLPNASKKPLKKVFLKHNYSTHTIKIDQENSVSANYTPPSQYQNNKTYTLLGYLPPPSLHTPVSKQGYKKHRSGSK